MVRRFSRLAAVAALAACLAACAQTQGGKPVPPRDLSAVSLDPVAANAMLTRYRTGRGLSAVRLDPQLGVMAQVQADAMAARADLSHDVAGSFTDRLRQAGIVSSSAAENIAGGYDSLEATFAGWRRSPEHDRNLLRPGMTRFGIALAKAPGRGLQTYWAMVVAAEPPPPDDGADGRVVARTRIPQTDLATQIGTGLGAAAAAPFALFGRP